MACKAKQEPPRPHSIHEPSNKESTRKVLSSFYLESSLNFTHFYKEPMLGKLRPSLNLDIPHSSQAARMRSSAFRLDGIPKPYNLEDSVLFKACILILQVIFCGGSASFGCC